MSDITRQLQGREIAEVTCNGSVAIIRTHCGAEIAIRWVDDNGVTIKGKPVLASKGFRLVASDLDSLIQLPEGAVRPIN